MRGGQEGDGACHAGPCGLQAFTPREVGPWRAVGRGGEDLTPVLTGAL